MLFKAVLTLESEDETLRFDQSNKYCAEQYVAVVPLIMLYKVVLTFECVYEILKCDHSNENY